MKDNGVRGFDVDASPTLIMLVTVTRESSTPPFKIDVPLTSIWQAGVGHIRTNNGYQAT